MNYTISSSNSSPAHTIQTIKSLSKRTSHPLGERSINSRSEVSFKGFLFFNTFDFNFIGSLSKRERRVTNIIKMSSVNSNSNESSDGNI